MRHSYLLCHIKRHIRLAQLILKFKDVKVSMLIHFLEHTVAQNTIELDVQKKTSGFLYSESYFLNFSPYSDEP
jgi:hypothetical protein